MKILFNILTNSLTPYPRNDDQPVQGLSSDFEIYDIVEEERPVFNTSTQYIVSKQIIDSVSKQVIRSWEIKDIPLYNPETQKIYFDTMIGEYIVSQKTKQEILQEKIAEGYNVSPENFTLALGDVDRSAFTQMLSLVKEALDLGLIDNTTPQIIADLHGNKHEVTTLRFRQIMVGYGLYYKALWDNL